MEVISNDQVLQLYDDPETSERGKDFTRWNYVEVVPGAEFKVKITLSKLFGLSSCEAVRISVAYDASNHHTGYSIQRSKLLKKFRSGSDYIVEFDHLNTFCEYSNQWKRGNLAFGALEISKSIFRRILASFANHIDRQWTQLTKQSL